MAVCLYIQVVREIKESGEKSSWSPYTLLVPWTPCNTQSWTSRTLYRWKERGIVSKRLPGWKSVAGKSIGSRSNKNSSLCLHHRLNERTTTALGVSKQQKTGRGPCSQVWQNKRLSTNPTLLHPPPAFSFSLYIYFTHVLYVSSQLFSFFLFCQNNLSVRPFPLLFSNACARDINGDESPATRAAFHVSFKNP